MVSFEFAASRAKTLVASLLFAVAIAGQGGAWAERSENGFGTNNKQTSQAAAAQGGKAVTQTEVVASNAVSPFLTEASPALMERALERYLTIQSAGGWPELGTIGKMKKGTESKGVAILNRRLYIEGYLRKEATEGEFAARFTSATEEAVKRFQRNNGLAVTGMADTATQKALNVPVERRIATIRANIPRLAEYSKNLGDRYLVVNVPALQIETVNAGKVYSRHNAIVGRPSRPTPVVQTALSMVKFNPYWNAPASIVEKDIIPRMISGGPSRVLKDMNITVFKGVGGPEVDPDTVDWRRAVADDYHFRQAPGGENAMKTAKIEFPSPFGIYLHDTPEPQLFKNGNRFLSSGCVRVERVEVLLNWILRGQDGIDQSRIAELAESQERLDVALKDPPQLRVVYLTAWPGADGIVSFRADVYDLDKSGFVVGQPLDVADTSGQRFTLTHIPRSPAAVDADEAFGFTLFRFKSSKNTDGVNKTVMKSGDITSGLKKKTAERGSAGKPFFMSSAEQAKARKLAENEEVADKNKGAAKTTKKPSTLATKDTKAKPAAKTAKTGGKAKECKAGEDSKLPEGCKTVTKKPKAKPEEQKTAVN